MKKAVSVIMSAILVGGIAAGCSSQGGDGKETASNNNAQKDAGQKVSISIWTLDTHLFADPVIEDFKKENPNIDVQLTKYGVDPFKEALKVAANSKTLPDLWFTWGGSLGSFYPENGLTMDLTQVAKDHGWSEKYNKAAIDMSTFGGKISGVPLHLNVLGMWYPKSVYSKFSLKAPATFADFEAQLKTIKDGGVTPLSFGGKGGWHTMRLTEQLLEHFAGPELHDKLKGLQASWNDPAVVKTFEKLKEYTDKGYFSKGYISLDPNEADALIYQEKAGFVMEGTWFDRNIMKAGFDPTKFDVFNFPNEQKPSRVSSFTEMLQINGKIDKAKQDAALKLAEFMTGAAEVSKHVEKYATPAALNVTYSDKTPHIKQMMDNSKDGTFLITDQALPQIIAQKLFECQDKVALGEWTPQQAAEAMEKASADYKSKQK
ncbi:ABC transporter substrate-binding protein [Paenibacillus piri]|uniref:Extracellular solute-binding protein n=1 Tax=Paenibacillus piri TaxID=2547395 RepID=A0A4R5KZM3_9BACL|nr:extracellular solute-binding protein [Paenibacillus piri]TDG00759.1 extracellular solute-binding protein [Paenibacillus piri]